MTITTRYTPSDRCPRVHAMRARQALVAFFYGRYPGKSYTRTGPHTTARYWEHGATRHAWEDDPTPCCPSAMVGRGHDGGGYACP